MSYDVDTIRSHFPSLDTGIAYFDGPGGSQVPDVVGAAIAEAITKPISNRNVNTESEKNAEELVLEFRKAVATATITALLLALADLRGRLEHWGDHPALNWLGERSYSIFLIHYGICIGINALWSLCFPIGLWINAVGIVVAVGLSLAAGALLYRLVETRNNALGLNAQTGFLLAAFALTLVLERSI